jgi:hypothetical protein
MLAGKTLGSNWIDVAIPSAFASRMACRNEPGPALSTFVTKPAFASGVAANHTPNKVKAVKEFETRLSLLVRPGDMS